jgi:gas vesicle protein
MNNTGKILIAALSGAAVGAIAGILFAPDKGSETRRRITDRTRKWTDAAGDLFAGDGHSGIVLKIRGNWTEIKARLRQQFSNLTDNDLYYTEGREEDLLARLQNKLGKKRDEIVDIINRLQYHTQH